jgi:hypothetical protein
MARWPGCGELFIIVHPVWRAYRRGSTWYDVLGCTPRELLRKPKVGKYDVAICGDEDVFWLEVTIDDTRCV